ncbi:uncharacterized protein LOC111047258 isoform X2 [Nilaparvata lugens]|uniref:uncharacterized protein LOC111047258 isoform X2 n=1 Tax=Nilaparvata lugens TaxID=108931 RepID=UPI000B9810C4|nr:uncharacterized protein LOC111047258 isoform X2 [Nilaparvata lugens]
MQVKLSLLLALSLIAGETIADSLAAAAGESQPQPVVHWKPTGRVLLLPAKQQTAQLYGPPPAEFANTNQQSPADYDDDTLSPPPEEEGTQAPFTDEYPTTTPQTDESSDGYSFITSEQQKEQPQVTSGVYHVLLPDGRLQRVEYTTAPLKQAAHTRNANPSQASSHQNADQTGQNSRTGQFSFQKPSFQSNQFALNSFKQNQYQENNLGQNSAQVSASGQYRTSQGSPSNFQSFYYQQQKEEPKSVSSQTTPSPKSSDGGKVSNKTILVKPVFVSAHFGPTPSKPAVSVSTQGKPSVSVTTQGKQFVGGQNQDTPAVSVQTVSHYTHLQPSSHYTYPQPSSHYTYPQPSYPSYTYQPIEFARQQEADNGPSSPFVFNGYLASVEYPGQQPVAPPSPVYYSYSSAPLVRIFRRTD